MTVQELRSQGYKVKVLHCRLYNGKHKWQQDDEITDVLIDPDPKGGSTTLIIDSPDGEHFEGTAVCSKKDNYNKKLGIRIALGRCGLGY